eukprot:2033341-Pleurochrysis_carterae.AAC.1
MEEKEPFEVELSIKCKKSDGWACREEAAAKHGRSKYSYIRTRLAAGPHAAKYEVNQKFMCLGSDRNKNSKDAGTTGIKAGQT